jgi:hypothetical protein
MREPRKCCATSEGTTVFWIHVTSGADRGAELLAGEYRTFGTCGNWATCAASARSHDSVWTPNDSSSCRASGRLNRETPSTRASVRPASSSARRSITAVVVPILPPTPRTRKSPGKCRTASVAPGVGRERRPRFRGPSWAWESVSGSTRAPVNRSLSAISQTPNSSSPRLRAAEFS